MRQAAGQYTGTEVFTPLGLTCTASLTVTSTADTCTCVMPAQPSKLDIAMNLDGQTHSSGRYTASYLGTHNPGTIDFKRQAPGPPGTSHSQRQVTARTRRAAYTNGPVRLPAMAYPLD
ncbi:hypothetical protein GCM10008956_05350 [Deinococcus arenae]|uniref:Uncharacterized protein n=1 Tax=Deinococcus arenae TaxID=1452751 RepID=A0A8H9L5N0_9DEIO|nr:hypothetical protein [Deinococcus arenae]GGM32097.1 hypothetical protein GCM10008956_05350 [Deinococcus arenae]